MKKTTVIICTTLMLCACTNEAPIEPDLTPQETKTEIRDEAEAIEMAEALAIGTKVEIENYFYFNWGRNGKDNGYFAAGVFDNTTPSKSRYNYNINPEYCYIYK